MEVQIFGTQKSPDTRKALRFFSERRIRVHFVNLAERAASHGELARFVQKFGVNALVDQTSMRYRDLGLSSALLSSAQWLERLVADPLLLRQPLARYGPRLTIGLAEREWRTWVAEGQGR